jgi:pyruvate, water dikinase
MVEVGVDRAGEAPSVIHCVADPGSSYTTTNLAEAMPGIATPLGWSFWGPASEYSGRLSWYALGVIPRSGTETPSDPKELLFPIFYGRIATRIDYFCEMGDLMPGGSGTDLARDAFGFVPPGYVSRPSRRRYPMVMVKMPVSFMRLPSAVARLRSETDAWWRAAIAQTPGLDLAGAGAQLLEAKRRFAESLAYAGQVIIIGVQPVYAALVGLAVGASIEPTSLMRGHGSHEETMMIEDLWAVSRERISLEAFLLKHGFNGPNVGDVSQRSWREDPGPLTAIVEGYRGKDAGADPVRAAAERAREREAAEAALLAAVPRSKRPQAHLLLRLAARYFPLRAVAKVAFTQSLDVARASARRAGALLAADGVIDDPEDVFLLTAEEIAERLPTNVRAVIAERKVLRARYAQLELPVSWTGRPTPTRIAKSLPDEGGTLQGVGVSAGVVEARVRVVLDPADTEMDEGDILVAHTTDPAWAPVMFLAGGLVVDIGGQLSHAAVVARELGIPCVMNTLHGTRALKTGDRCRVDGAAGTVEILSRAGARTQP